MEETRDQQGSLSPIGRMAAGAAITLAVIGVALFLLMRGGGYTVHARFQAATQMVKGNVVQVAGRTVGTVKRIELTRDGQADLELELDDDVAPLRVGTQATLRIRSLSGVVNRFVDLRIPPAGGEKIPDGGVIPASRTTSAVDLDELFDLFDAKARRGLRNVIRGSAAQYAGRGPQANAGWRYLNPSLVAAKRLFAEINHDTPLLERFLLASSKLVGDVADRDTALSALVDRLATMTGAIADEERSLSTAIGELPPFMRRANTTFVNLRATLDDLDPLVAESKPVTPKLRAVLAELRPFATAARPVVHRLADLVKRGGKDNDLIDLGRATLPFREVAVGPLTVNGKQRPGSFPTSTRSLREQRPHLAFFRPYAVDFTGWLDDFSHSGIYDANGSASRSAISVNAFAAVNGLLQPIPPELRNAAFDAVSARGQTNRCPGSAERPAADGTSPFRPSPDFNCDPTQIPPGE